MTAVLAVAGVELRRFLKDRSNIFFVFIFPLALVLLLGLQFGGAASAGRVALAGDSSDLRGALVRALEERDVEVTLAEDDQARELLARGRTDVGLFVGPAAAESFAAGRDADLELVVGAQVGSQLAVQQVQAAVRAVTTEQGQLTALTSAGVPEDAARTALVTAGSAYADTGLRVVEEDELAQEFAGVSGFEVGAAGQMLLFVFLTSLTGAATLIQGRRHGVLTRTLAAPVSSLQAIAGQALGRLAIATAQGAYIVVGTAVLFDVDWGSLPVTIAVLVVFAAVAAAAAMILGSVMDNDGAASGLGVALGLVLAALGGCMFPLELFPDTLRTIAHVTPHAWGYEALAEVQRRGGGLLDVLPQLAVLAAMAVLLLAIGSWALRRSLQRAL